MSLFVKNYFTNKAYLEVIFYKSSILADLFAMIDPEKDRIYWHQGENLNCVSIYLTLDELGFQDGSYIKSNKRGSDPFFLDGVLTVHLKCNGTTQSLHISKETTVTQFLTWLTLTTKRITTFNIST